MKILVVCQYYWPEPFNSTDLCETLVQRGHQVTVLTAMPNYGMPSNDVPPAYQGKRHYEESRNGVRILRVGVHPRLSGAVNRIRNYLSFWVNAKRFVGLLDDDFDVVLGCQFSPIMQVDPGIVYARKHRKKMLLYCFDLWPASLLAGGFSEESMPFRWMRAVSKRIYSQADRIAVTSPLFDEYFRDELGLQIPDSLYLPQYAEDIFSAPTEAAAEGYDPSKVNVTFAGNVGQAQSVMTIVEAAAQLVDEPNIVFHIVGSGSRLEACQLRARGLGLENIVFHGRKPLEDMPAYYSASDAMLATFASSPMGFYTLPRKVQSYLAAGKPVLAALEGEAERVIREAQCGMCCGFEDAEGLARIVRTFVSGANAQELGKNARAYYEKHFSKASFFEHLEQALLELVD